MKPISNTGILKIIATGCMIMLIIFPFSVSAQKEHKLFGRNLLIEAKVNYGFLYAHNIVLEQMQSHVTAFEFNIHKETYGKHEWERAWAYPEIGLSFWYSTIGKAECLGDVYSIFPYINFPVVRSGDFSFNFRFGLGVGYLTKPFDHIENYKNLAIGSHFNASANLMLEARYVISDRLTASAGISLQHFSNGSLKLPNYGINLPLINAGMAYRLEKRNPLIDDRFFAPTKRFEAIIRHQLLFDFGALIGYKDMSEIYGSNYFVYHIFENSWIPVGRKSKWGIGFDLSYDASHIKKLEISGDTVTNKMTIIRPGINAAYAMSLSELNVVFNLGYYLGGAESSDGPLYEKLAFQYNFTKDLFATVMLKVHWGKADYIGWGIGLRFEKWYGKKVLK